MIFIDIMLRDPPILLRFIATFLRIYFTVWFWHRVYEWEELLGDLDIGNRAETVIGGTCSQMW